MTSTLFGIIGCGLIGHKRACALPHGALVACHDIDPVRSTKFAQEHNVESCSSVDQLLSRGDIDAIIVCTLHNSLAELTLRSIEAGKHVFVEKPAAISTKEIKPLILSAQSNNRLVRVGFNHRYHRAFRKAYSIFKSGSLGEMMFVRARYGHGGRLGYDKEWRANPLLSGGGELLDQGPHLIDLSRLFLGDFTKVSGTAKTFYWNMPVDDNAFLLLETQNSNVAFLHVSCTEWKNTFSMEIYGSLGKLQIEGLGGSYGPEKLTFYKMLPEMGPPETIAWEYPMADDSWSYELNLFIEDIKLNREPCASLGDAEAMLHIIEKIYSYD